MKDINKVNLSPSYSRIPYKDFAKRMKAIGFDGDFDAAYKSIGGQVPKKKKQEGVE